VIHDARPREKQLQCGHLLGAAMIREKRMSWAVRDSKSFTTLKQFKLNKNKGSSNLWWLRVAEGEFAFHCNRKIRETTDPDVERP